MKDLLLPQGRFIRTDSAERRKSVEGSDPFDLEERIVGRGQSVGVASGGFRPPRALLLLRRSADEEARAAGEGRGHHLGALQLRLQSAFGSELNTQLLRKNVLFLSS